MVSVKTLTTKELSLLKKFNKTLPKNP